MKTISLCMITKDEQDFLENSLNSVKKLVDEIIVVDTGSKDKTKKIAKKFTDNVFDLKWENDFSKARNFSISKATKDWILVLDADEVISKEDHEKIKKLLETGADAFSLIQRNYTNDSKAKDWKTAEEDVYKESKRYSGWFEAVVTRLFRKGFQYSGEVHESIINSLAGGKLVKTNIPIHHYNVEKNKEEKEEKSKKYLELGKKKAEENKDAASYYELGLQQIHLGNFKEAEDAFLSTLEANPGIIEAYQNLGVVYLKTEMFDKAATMLFKAINLDKNNPVSYSNLGVVFVNTGRLKEAELLFRKALELDPKYAAAYRNLANCLYKQGKQGEAEEVKEKAEKLNPKYKNQ